MVAKDIDSLDLVLSVHGEEGPGHLDITLEPLSHYGSIAQVEISQRKEI